MSVTAEQIFRSYLATNSDPSTADIEALCAAHPEVADELRQLYLSKPSTNAEMVGDATVVSSQRVPSETPAMVQFVRGQRLGSFTLIERLGRGGMGEVWEAQQAGLERRVALKLLMPDRVNERSLEFFAREARAGGRLQHPGIISIFGAGAVSDIHWLSMELVEGGRDLKGWLDEHRAEPELPEEYYDTVAEFIAYVADALEAAHAVDVIHRDLKPANIMVGIDGRPKVVDFGLAKLVDENSLSVQGDIAGTFFYMSPEQVVTKTVGLDHRSDVFSLGVVFYEMLTLVRPFEGDTTEQVAQKIVWEEAPHPVKVRSKVPVDLAVICNKAMEKAPSARYPSMKAFADDLRRHLAGEPIHARPAGQVARLRKWIRRNPTRSAVAGVFAAAMLVISILAANLQRERTELASKTALLLEVTRFQTEQLQKVNLDDMGGVIRELVLEQAAKVRKGSELPDAEIDRDLATVEQMSDAMFKRVARDALVREFLQQMVSEVELLDNRYVQGSLYDTVGITYKEWDMASEAELVQLQAVKALEEELGDDARETLEVKRNLAKTWCRLKRYDESEQLLLKVLEAQRAMLGDHDAETLATLDSLAVVYIKTDKYREAEEVLLEALEGWRASPSGSIGEFGTMTNLANLYRRQQQFDKAEALHGQVLIEKRRLFGDQDVRTLNSINNLACAHMYANSYTDAKPLFEEALAGYREVYLAEHRDTLKVMHRLGYTLAQLEDFEDARLLLREALDGYRKRSVRGNSASIQREIDSIERILSYVDSQFPK